MHGVELGAGEGTWTLCSYISDNISLVLSEAESQQRRIDKLSELAQGNSSRVNGAEIVARGGKNSRVLRSSACLRAAPCNIMFGYIPDDGFRCTSCALHRMYQASRGCTLKGLQVYVAAICCHLQAVCAVDDIFRGS